MATVTNTFSVGDWSRTIELIEAQGWTLVHWQVLPDGKNARVFPPFRLAR